VLTLAVDIYGKASGETRARQVLDILDADHSGSISRREFIDYIDKYPMLLFPAFRMQQCIRSKLMGTAFWIDEERRRLALCGGVHMTIFGLLDFAHKQAMMNKLPAVEEVKILNQHYDDLMLLDFDKSELEGGNTTTACGVKEQDNSSLKSRASTQQRHSHSTSSDKCSLEEAAMKAEQRISTSRGSKRDSCGLFNSRKRNRSIYRVFPPSLSLRFVVAFALLEHTF
jgi:hypothetical protein